MQNHVELLPYLEVPPLNISCCVLHDGQLHTKL
jgi:hypothetical protein